MIATVAMVRKVIMRITFAPLSADGKAGSDVLSALRPPLPPNLIGGQGDRRREIRERQVK
jgi:hypothetical protein